MNLNSVSLIGRVTRDPEVKALPSGTEVCNFSLVTNHTYKDRDGKKQESSEFHNIICFGKTAATIGQYVVKGQLLYVEGRLQTRSWEKDGSKHYRTEILLNQFQFGPKAGGSESASASRDEDEAPEFPEEEINPEDIPF